jgi:phage terminase large subunit GpA-like protein
MMMANFLTATICANTRLLRFTVSTILESYEPHRAPYSKGKNRRRGDMICPYCHKDMRLKISNPEEYKRRKAANARASAAKALANGTHVGRKKIRNDEQIRHLRSLGKSIRQIAFECGVSTAAVQRGLK